MELNTLLTELLAEPTGKIDANIDDRTRRIETLISGEFTGKVKTISDLKTLIKSIKQNEDKWIKILYGSNTQTKKSPLQNAEEVENIIDDMSPQEIEQSIPENNPDGKKLTMNQKIVYSFIDDIEEQLQKIAIGNYDTLFHVRRKKITDVELDGEDYEENEVSKDLAKKRIRNIIPIRVEIFGDVFYGIVRPGSSGGSNGIITWQKVVDSFDAKLDHYSEKYDSLSDEQKAEYDVLRKNFLTAGKLPRTLPLIKRTSDSSLLKIHETQEIKAIKGKGVLIYKDDPETLLQVDNIIVDAVKSSGDDFAGENVSSLSKEDIAEYLGIIDSDKKIVDIPVWVISSVGFWNGIKKLF